MLKLQLALHQLILSNNYTFFSPVVISNFILKDLVIKDSISDSLAFNLLGVLNLRNILGKLANLDLSIDEFTSMQLGRVEGDLLFSKSKLRLASPLFIETNAAKMKWVGQINKNSKNNLLSPP